MSADLELQNAIYAALTQDSALTALLATNPYDSPTVSAVYDDPPQMDAPEDASAFPYVIIGDDVSSQFDTDEIKGKEYIITLHVWDRYLGRRRVKQIMDRLYNLLHDSTLHVIGVNSIFCFWESSLMVPDDDDLTQHGVTRFRIAVQE
jgi:hypothetical protein